MNIDITTTPQPCDRDFFIPPMPENASLAFAYIKFQQYGDISPTDEALLRGTVFGELYMPYQPAKRRSRDGCIK